MEIIAERLGFFAVAFGLALSACATIEVHADYDPSMDFSALNSFGWLPEDLAQRADPRSGNQLVSDRVSQAIERELAAMGFELTEANADFGVGFSISVERGLDVYSEPVYYGHYSLYSHYGNFGAGYGARVHADEFERGLMQIDFVDTKAKRLLWRGTSSYRVIEGMSPEQSSRRIKEIVAKILSQFPPAQN